jgi:hypothetical protein
MATQINPRSISLAHPRLQRAWRYLEESWPTAHPNDPKPFLSQVFRTAAVQAAYYAQGRKGLHEVNALRQTAGLAPLAPTENLRKVTNAAPGRSKHERSPSEAFDIAFVKAGTTRELDWTPRLFLQAAVLIRTADPTITWGGDWNKNWKTQDEKFVDLPHFEV